MEITIQDTSPQFLENPDHTTEATSTTTLQIKLTVLRTGRQAIK